MKTSRVLIAIASVLLIYWTIAGCGKDESNGPVQEPLPTLAWQATSLSGGTVRALVVNNNGSVFASIDGDGVYRTTDDGATWSKTLNGPFQSAIGTGYADCFYVDGNTLWAGTDSAGIWYSTDEATTWAEMNDGQSVGHVFDIEAGDELFCASSMGIFRFDEQNGWTQLESNSTYALFMTYEGYSSQSVYAGGPYLPGGDPGIILWSSNNGSSWYRTAIRGIVRAFALDSKGVVYAATTLCYSGGPAYGVFRKDNEWYSWKGVYSGLEYSDLSFESIAVSPSDQIYIGSTSSGVYCSTNGGELWTAVNSGLTNKRVRELAINPSGFIYAGTEAGVFRASF
jgi:photosystem II stability/assembly factor-like uncharacterized protein